MMTVSFSEANAKRSTISAADFSTTVVDRSDKPTGVGVLMPMTLCALTKLTLGGSLLIIEPATSRVGNGIQTR